MKFHSPRILIDTSNEIVQTSPISTELQTTPLWLVPSTLALLDDAQLSVHKKDEHFFFTFCVVMRSESPNLSEGSDSTNYLTTVSVERYNNRPPSSAHRSTTIDGNNHHRTSRYTPLSGQEEFNRTNYSNPLSKSIDPQVNYRSAKSKRSVEWDEENIQKNEGRPLSLSHTLTRPVTSDRLNNNRAKWGAIRTFLFCQ